MSTSFENNQIRKEKSVEIKNLFFKEKHDSVIKYATKYLDECPNDVIIRFMRAKTYRILKRFDEAIDDLKYNLSLGYNDHSITELFFIYYFKGMYKEAFELIPILREHKNLKLESLDLFEFIIRHNLGLEKNRNSVVKFNYVTSQIIKYDEKNAISHIKCHLDGNKNKSLFYTNIDIEYLYYLVRDNINDSNKANMDEVLQVHHFTIPNIGYNDSGICNCLKVIVVPMTNNIISMYPVSYYQADVDDCFEYDHDKLFKKKENDEPKVKRLSKIDKFNQRYGRDNK